jgi:splicing factor U2AF subunit
LRNSGRDQDRGTERQREPEPQPRSSGLLQYRERDARGDPGRDRDARDVRAVRDNNRDHRGYDRSNDRDRGDDGSYDRKDDRREDRRYRDDRSYRRDDRRSDRRDYNRRDFNNRREFRRDHRDYRDRDRDYGREERQLHFKLEEIEAAIPIDKIERKSLWDIKPKGFEKVSSERAKISGLFPLPGEARRVDISKVEGLVSSGDLNSHTSILFDEINIDPSSSRSSKQLIVTGVEFTLYPVDRLVENFKTYISSLAIDGALIVRYELLLNKYLILHVSTNSLATVLLASQYNLQKELKLGIKIERPRSYITPTVDQDSEQGADSANKIAIVNVPGDISEDELKEHLDKLSPGCFFETVKTHEGQSTGVVFVTVTNMGTSDAIEKIKHILMKDVTLNAIPACAGLEQDQRVTFRSIAKISQSNTINESNVIVILNAIQPEDLKKDIIYDQVQRDMASECSKFGQVISLKIPKPDAEYKRNLKNLHTSVGKIFIKFDSVETAKKAALDLNGRKYQERTVLVSYLPEQDFELNLF